MNALLRVSSYELHDLFNIVFTLLTKQFDFCPWLLQLWTSGHGRLSIWVEPPRGPGAGLREAEEITH